MIDIIPLFSLLQSTLLYYFVYKKLGLMERRLKVRKQEEDPRSVQYKYTRIVL